MKSPVETEIYDLGYRHYQGPRLGRRGAWRALFLDGIAVLFGIGRGAKAKIAPFLMIGMTVIPALVQAAVVGLIGPQVNLFSHEAYFGSTVWVYALFCAMQTPELISADQQSRVLALYFARAIKRLDYLTARFASLAASLFLVAVLPHLILLLGRLMAAENFWSALADELPVVPRILFAAMAVALLMAAVSLLIASFLTRKSFATGVILAVLLLSSLVSVPLVHLWPRLSPMVLVSPTLTSEGIARWTFERDASFFAVKDTIALFGLAPDPLPVTATMDDSLAWRRANQSYHRKRASLSVVQMANLPAAAYLGSMLATLLLVGVILVPRFRRMEP